MCYTKSLKSILVKTLLGMSVLIMVLLAMGMAAGWVCAIIFCAQSSQWGWFIAALLPVFLGICYLIGRAIH